MLKYMLTLTLMALSIGTAEADHRQYDMRVDGLTCPFCIATSAKALKRIEGVYEVAADLDTGIVSVCAASQTDLGDARMKRLFRSKGFTYRSQTVSEGCTIKEISHADTGENLIGSAAHPASDPSGADVSLEKENHTAGHSGHHGHGS